MKSRKKVLSLIVGLVICLAIFAGCGGNSSGSILDSGLTQQEWEDAINFVEIDNYFFKMDSNINNKETHIVAKREGNKLYEKVPISVDSPSIIIESYAQKVNEQIYLYSKNEDEDWCKEEILSGDFNGAVKGALSVFKYKDFKYSNGQYNFGGRSESTSGDSLVVKFDDEKRLVSAVGSGSSTMDIKIIYGNQTVDIPQERPLSKVTYNEWDTAVWFDDVTTYTLNIEGWVEGGNATNVKITREDEKLKHEVFDTSNNPLLHNYYKQSGLYIYVYDDINNTWNSTSRINDLDDFLYQGLQLIFDNVIYSDFDYTNDKYICNAEGLAALSVKSLEVEFANRKLVSVKMVRDDDSILKFSAEYTGVVTFPE